MLQMFYDCLEMDKSYLTEKYGYGTIDWVVPFEDDYTFKYEGLKKYAFEFVNMEFDGIQVFDCYVIN